MEHYIPKMSYWSLYFHRRIFLKKRANSNGIEAEEIIRKKAHSYSLTRRKYSMLNEKNVKVQYYK